MVDEKHYNSHLIPKPVEDRPTEDDLARASLGGPRGSSSLPPAPLTEAEAEQMPSNYEPGHVA
jgi:hypothetical protein